MPKLSSNSTNEPSTQLTVNNIKSLQNGVQDVQTHKILMIESAYIEKPNPKPPISDAEHSLFSSTNLKRTQKLIQLPLSHDVTI